MIKFAKIFLDLEPMFQSVAYSPKLGVNCKFDKLPFNPFIYGKSEFPKVSGFEDWRGVVVVEGK